MKVYWQATCGCLLLAGGLAAAGEVSGAMAATQPTAAASQPGRELIRGEYAVMVRVLDLSQTQQQQLTVKLKARQEALDAWEQANGKKLDDLERLTQEQPKNSQIADEFKKLRQGREKVVKEHREAVLSILTDQQRAKWEEFSFFRRVSRVYGSVNLTKEAQEKMKGLCAQAVRELRGLEDKEARGKVMEKLHQDIQSQVLSPDQLRSWKQQRDEKQKAPSTKPAATQPAGERSGG
jgi:hypothetical protein